jgi:hypothetical protein
MHACRPLSGLTGTSTGGNCSYTDLARRSVDEQIAPPCVVEVVRDLHCVRVTDLLWQNDDVEAIVNTKCSFRFDDLRTRDGRTIESKRQ